MSKLFKVLLRKKVLDPVAITETRLARVLNTYDLTALGVGSTLGVGVYVLAGHVAKEVAGPAVVLSFLIAAIASVFAGLCYAEFGSRVPRAGSAYIYSYVCVGEFIAFVIGWNLILEYVIGSASVARGLSLYLDTLINNTLQDTFREIAPINVSFMSAYFDFFSFGLSVMLAAALAFGMKESSRVNNIFTTLNILVVLFVIIGGSIKANPKNWDLPAPSNSTDGTGGFFPYGFSGMIKGAATCFYGFVGFDCIATTGEEVKNPQRAIPLSIIASLMIIFLAYFGTATVVTLMIPYYLQDINAPIPHAFAEVGWDVAKWIVAIGGIFGLCASLFGAMFPLPRVIYAMASDGIIFRFLGNVSARFHTPLIGTLLAGLLTGLMSGLFELKQLVNMMSIGTLLAYTIVAACVLLLRYVENEGFNPVESADSTELIDPNEKVTFCGCVKQTFNFQRLQNPTKTSQAVVIFQICIYALLCLALGLCIMYLQNEIKHARVWAIVLVSVIGLLMILVIMSIATQPNSKKEIKFKVPLVPLVPALSILVNIYLMLMLDVNTWIRFGVWMAVGLPIYFISVCCADSSLNSSNNYPKVHAKLNGVNQISKSNGHTNSRFSTDDQKTGSNGIKEPDLKEDSNFVKSALLPESSVITLKPKAPSPPPISVVPPTADTSACSSPDNLSVNGALAALDDVLNKEELAIVSSFTSENPFSRKMSIDTVSNASNVHFEETHVALVHHEDTNLDSEFPPPIIEEQIENDVQSDSSINTINSEKSNELEDNESNSSSESTVVAIIAALKDITNNNKNEDGESTTFEVEQKEETCMDQGEQKGDSEDITTENNASEPENNLDSELPQKLFVPPPPPSMENFEKFVPRIPRISITNRSKDDIHTIKSPSLRPVMLNRSKSEPEVNFRNDNERPDSPPPDYTISRQMRVVEDVDDNIMFGSKQHVKVASKLNKLLQRKSMGLPAINKLTKPEVPVESEVQFQQPVATLPGMKQVLAELPKSTVKINEDNEEIAEPEGVVVEEVMKPADIKKKLNEILRSDPRLTMRPLKSNIAVSNIVEQSEINRTDTSKDTENDSNQPNNEEAIDGTVINAEVTAKLLHKNLMGNTLKSIKLRKVDSFKTS